MKACVRLKPLFKLIFLILFMFSIGLAQEQIGSTVQAAGNNCNTGVSETRVAARAGYIGTVGANIFPKVNDITNVFVTFQVLGTPCGLEGVYVEVLLPDGATTALANNRPVRCLLNGSEVTGNPEFSCGIFNESSLFGGIVLGTNLLFSGQTMAINVPVRFTRGVHPRSGG